MAGRTMAAALQVTKALADRQRVRILMMLRPGELCVCQIVEVLALAPSTVSKHLSILSAAGLVEVRKDGRWMYYRRPVGAGGALARPLMRWLETMLAGDGTLVMDDARRRRVTACEPRRRSRERRRGGGATPGRHGHA